MKLPRISGKSLMALLGSLLAVTVFVAPALNQALAAGRGTMVIFNANWCASCREVVPIAQEIAGQNGMTVRQIDVDAQDAPKQASSLGLSIPNGEPPQIFYVNRGRSILLYNGRGYKFGYSDAVRSTILQNLQQVLQSGASGS